MRTVVQKALQGKSVLVSCMWMVIEHRQQITYKERAGECLRDYIAELDVSLSFVAGTSGAPHVHLDTIPDATTADAAMAMDTTARLIGDCLPFP